MLDVNRRKQHSGQTQFIPAQRTCRCDRLAGLCILHSLAGGTGSGLGTCLTEVRKGTGQTRRPLADLLVDAAPTK